MKNVLVKIVLVAMALSFTVMSASAGVPAKHEEFMKNENYKTNYENLAAQIKSMEGNLPPDAYQAFVTANDKAIDALVKEYVGAGVPEERAYAMVYEERVKDVERESLFDWLRKNATGVQGLYRLQSDAFEGYMTVAVSVESENSDEYEVGISVTMKREPYGSGAFEGFSSKLSDKKITVPYYGQEGADDEKAVTITFEGENATVVSSQTFKASGALGARVVLDGTYVREKQ